MTPESYTRDVQTPSLTMFDNMTGSIILSSQISSRSFSNVYFLDNMTLDMSEAKDDKEIPSDLHILNHVYRFGIVTVITSNIISSYTI